VRSSERDNPRWEPATQLRIKQRAARVDDDFTPLRGRVATAQETRRLDLRPQQAREVMSVFGSRSAAPDLRDHL
jgi:hypothetical protein